ncbi:hypothetical protein ASG92_18150 [Arthrobacter sp. Soil736]|uniref:EAL domain-containing protein n=1 Tax=Arthrobacter sp. Soil736 TaxID=1736395 RepID=UPI0006F8D83B|nr:EAL domain-containing protein [Arthrobacter sp. Soil736]KRE65319.1 hypothetical protein ASG92_18150 [Arthrobacter sp. Soil736]
MSRDESSLPAATGAKPSPEPWGQVSPPQDVEESTLRCQVLQLINDVLTDTAPEGEWARIQLRRLLAANPDEPERALLQHLISVTTTDLTDSPADDAPHRGLGRGQESSAPATPRYLPASPDRKGRKRITAVLGSRMLLTAFQPIRELPAGNVVGFEALARFVSRDGASADTWFREAAAIGLGADLEIAALHSALSAAREIPAHLFVAFNLSPATCTDPRVQALLESGQVALDRIVIELAGRVGPELDGLIRALGPLRQRGLRLAVDGSGAGAASRDQILQLVPDIIKLDRNFINGLIHPGEAQSPGVDVVELAEQTGAALSAEGIESQAELAAVTEAGLAAGQGYLLGRPSVHPLDWSAWIIEAATDDVPASAGNGNPGRS